MRTRLRSMTAMLVAVTLSLAVAAPASASALTDVYFACAEATGAPACYDVYRAAYDVCVAAFTSPLGPLLPADVWPLVCFG